MIYCIGDSFTYGEELSDRQNAWPSLLSTRLGRPVTNQGRPASGNYRMVKRAIDAAMNNDTEMIIIGWTDPCRQEFADDLGITDIWAGREYSRMQSCNDHRINLIKYMTAYDVPGYYYRQWLRQIILVQSLCQAKNIRLLMFSACASEKFHGKYLKFSPDLEPHIDTKIYVDWPNGGCVDWTHGTPVGPNFHPLEQGHRMIAQRIYEHIRNLSWLP